jgi:hypothetical protein
MVDLDEVLRPRPDPAAVPPPLTEIAARARRRTQVRRGAVASLATVVVVAASAWGMTRFTGPDDPGTVIDPAATGEAPAPTSSTTTTTTSTPTSTPTTTAPTRTTSSTTPSTTTSAPPLPPTLAATIEDGDIGTSDGTVEYTGDTWTRCGDCNIATPDASYRYAFEAGDSFTVRFTGVRLVLHAPDDRFGGTASVTVDGQPADTATIDYAAARAPVDGVRWDSGLLPDGQHTVVVTAQPGPDEVILLDRADVYTEP